MSARRPRVRPRPRRARAAIPGLLTLALGLVPAVAQGQQRFAVMDVSPVHGPAALVAEIEREVERLRPALKRIDEGPVARALRTGETAEGAFARLVAAAEEKRAAGDCQQAVELAVEAEEVGLGGVAMDDERDGLKSAYVIQIACQHQLGREDEARAASMHLRTLVTLPPSALPKDLWARYAPPSPDPAGKAPPPRIAELQIDSEPPNAHVAIDFHGEGVTPRSIKLPAGTVLVEVEKEGYKKAFRRVTLDAAPVRVAFRLTERVHDRADQVVNTLLSLRGADLSRRRTALSRLCQLSRADVLVALAVEGDTVRIWFFDSDRGDLTGAPIVSRFDAQTGRVAALAERPTPTPMPAPGAPAPAPAQAQPGAPAGSVATGARSASEPAPVPALAPGAPESAGLPEAESKKPFAEYHRAQPWRKDDDHAFKHWYTWVIAAGVVVAVYFLVQADATHTKSDLGVGAHWNGPRP